MSFYGRGDAAQGHDPRNGGGNEYAAAPPAARPAAPIEQRVAPPPMAPKSPGEKVVELSRPYLSQDTEIRIVRFRQPTAGDLRKCGYPLRNVITPGVGVTALEELPDVIGKYMTLLSSPQLLPHVVNSMELEDFARCSGAVMDFFL